MFNFISLVIFCCVQFSCSHCSTTLVILSSFLHLTQLVCTVTCSESKEKYMWICIVLSRRHIPEALRYDTLYKGSQFTQFYLPPNTSHACLYSPATEHRPLAGTHCTYPWMGGQAELTQILLHLEFNLDMITHPSTN